MSLSAPARLRSFFSAIATLVLGGLLAMGFALPAQADTVAFTVRVASAAGTPLSGMGIAAFAVVDGDADTSKPLVNALPVTGQPGVYTLPGLEEVPYTLVMRPSSTATAKAFIQYLGGVSSVDRATTFIPGANNTSLDVTLAANGVITGTVTGSTKKPLAGVWVTAYRFDGTQWDEYTSVKTSAKGVYSLTDIDPGSYKLGFDGPSALNAAPQYSGAKATLESATPLYVGSNKSVTLNAKLAVGGMIRGSSLLWVEDEGHYYLDTVLPVAYRVTQQFATTPIEIDRSTPYYGVRSNAKGAWSIGGLPTGNYVVKLASQYIDVTTGWIGAPWSGDQSLFTDVSDATILSVTQGAVRTVPGAYVESTLAGPFISTVQVTSNGVALNGAHVTMTLADLDDEVYEAETANGGFAQLGQDVSGQPMLSYGSYVVTATKEGFDPLVMTVRLDPSSLISLVMVPAVPLVFTTAPAVTGDAIVGDTVSVSADVSRAAALRYTWLRDGMPIFGATSATYTIAGGDLGHHISVRVRADAASQVASSTAHVGGDNSVVGAGAAAVNTEAPSILAPAVVRPGTKLVARAGSWDIGGVRPVYSWLRNGEPIATALGSSYVVTAGDVGSDIHLTVIATKAGRPDSVPSTTDGVHVDPLPAPVAKIAPKLTAKKVGSTTTYTVVPGTWTAGTTFGYEWTVDGVPSGATKSFRVDAALAGKSVVVKITAQQPGSLWTQRALVAVKGAKLSAPQSAPVVINTAEDIAVTNAAQPVQVGRPLSVTGHTGTWTYPDGSAAANFSYQWRKAAPGKAAVAIKGATKASYTPTIADLKGTLSLAITANSPVYASTTLVIPAGTVILDQRLVESSQVPWLRGFPYPGSTLTADAGTWPVTGVTVAYQWFLGDVMIPKATKATYVPTAAQLDSEVRVRITASKPGFASRVFFASTTIYAPDAIDVIEPLHFTGGLVDGDGHLGVPLVATPGVYDVPGLTRTYVWERFTGEVWMPVAGTPVGTTYTPLFADLMVEEPGIIRVTETVSVGELTTSHFAQVTIHEGTNVVVTAPKLTASKSAWSVTDGIWRAPGSAVSWEWIVDGAATATGRTLPIVGRTGKSVVAIATVSAPGFPTVLREVVVQKGAKPSVTPGVITGSPQVASPLQAPAGVFTYPSWVGGTPTVAYQWLVNGVVIKGATAATYVPRVTDLGKKISVRLISRSAYVADNTYTATVRIYAGSATGVATLVGPSVVTPGTPLSVQLSGYTSGGTRTIQWGSRPTGGVSFEPIAGATKPSYIPKFTEVGRDILARVITKRTGFSTHYAYTDAASVVTPGALAPVIAPVITGSATVGSTLTVSPGSWTAAATTFGYQWYRNGVAIPGATGTTFVPLADSHNDELWVVVTAKSVGYVTATGQSNVVTPGLGAAPIALAGKGPKITGTAKTCTTLTASSGAWNLDGLTFSYAWAVDGDVVTGRTLDLGQGLVGQTVTVTVTATRAGYLVGTATSAATTAITSGNCG